MNPVYLSKRLFIFFSKFIPCGMRLRILKGPLRGYKWIVGAAAGEAKGLSILLNLSEPEQMETAKEIISKSNICFDIGANVGVYTLLFSRYSKTVYAFEPIPRNLSFLYKVIKINKIKNAIIIPCAVAERNKIAWFRVGKNYALGRLNINGNQPVLAVSLDSFIEESKISPHIVKIDVEGAELSVLEGGKDFFSELKPIIFLSTHGDKVKNDCLEFLKQLNYQIIKPLDEDSIEKATEFLIKPKKNYS